MTAIPETEQAFPSTTFEWKRVKIRRPPEAKTQRRAKRATFLRLPRSDRYRTLTVRVTYRGGAEAWWLIEARGERQAFPGHLSLEDVMARVHSER